MKVRRFQPHILTRDPTLRSKFIELLKTGMSQKEIATILGVPTHIINVSLRTLLRETAYQLANEDEIAKLWACVWSLSKRLTDLENLSYKNPSNPTKP